VSPASPRGRTDAGSRQEGTAGAEPLPAPVGFPEDGRARVAVPGPGGDGRPPAGALPGAAPGAPVVPVWLLTCAAWSWRLLVIMALGWVLLTVATRLETLVVALFVGLLATALLQPAVIRLRRWGVPRALATAVVLLGAVAIALALGYLITRALLAQADDLAAAVTDGISSIGDWLAASLGLGPQDLLGQAGRLLGPLLGGGGGGGLPGTVFGAASTALEVLGGAGIAVLATVFFVHDGAGMWRRVLGAAPVGARRHLRVVGPQAWHVLSSYARGTVLVAAIDGLGIGLGVALVGVPLALPIGVLVFLSSFVPVIGALLSGLVAVLIALATEGPGKALAVLGIVIAVQQLEGHVLQPVIQGNLVALHPLLIVLAVSIGSLAAGIAGAVIAVPVVAVARTLLGYSLAVARARRRERAAVIPTG